MPRKINIDPNDFFMEDMIKFLGDRNAPKRKFKQNGGKNKKKGRDNK